MIASDRPYWPPTEFSEPPRGPGSGISLLPETQLVGDFTQDPKDALPVQRCRAVAVQVFVEGWTEGDGAVEFTVQSATEMKEEQFVDVPSYSVWIQENLGEGTKIVVIPTSALARFIRVRVGVTLGNNSSLQVYVNASLLRPSMSLVLDGQGKGDNTPPKPKPNPYTRRPGESPGDWWRRITGMGAIRDWADGIGSPRKNPTGEAPDGSDSDVDDTPESGSCGDESDDAGSGRDEPRKPTREAQVDESRSTVPQGASDRPSDPPKSPVIPEKYPCRCTMSCWSGSYPGRDPMKRDNRPKTDTCEVVVRPTFDPDAKDGVSYNDILFFAELELSSWKAKKVWVEIELENPGAFDEVIVPYSIFQASGLQDQNISRQLQKNRGKFGFYAECPGVYVFQLRSKGEPLPVGIITKFTAIVGEQRCPITLSYRYEEPEELCACTAWCSPSLETLKKYVAPSVKPINRKKPFQCESKATGYLPINHPDIVQWMNFQTIYIAVKTYGAPNALLEVEASISQQKSTVQWSDSRNLKLSAIWSSIHKDLDPAEANPVSREMRCGETVIFAFTPSDTDQTWVRRYDFVAKFNDEMICPVTIEATYDEQKAAYDKAPCACEALAWDQFVAVTYDEMTEAGFDDENMENLRNKFPSVDVSLLKGSKEYSAKITAEKVSSTPNLPFSLLQVREGELPEILHCDEGMTVHLEPSEKGLQHLLRAAAKIDVTNTRVIELFETWQFYANGDPCGDPIEFTIEVEGCDSQKTMKRAAEAQKEAIRSFDRVNVRQVRATFVDSLTNPQPEFWLGDSGTEAYRLNSRFEAALAVRVEADLQFGIKHDLPNCCCYFVEKITVDVYLELFIPNARQKIRRKEWLRDPLGKFPGAGFVPSDLLTSLNSSATLKALRRSLATSLAQYPVCEPKSESSCDRLKGRGQMDESSRRALANILVMAPDLERQKERWNCLCKIEVCCTAAKYHRKIDSHTFLKMYGPFSEKNASPFSFNLRGFEEGEPVITDSPCAVYVARAGGGDGELRGWSGLFHTLSNPDREDDEFCVTVQEEETVPPEDTSRTVCNAIDDAIALAKNLPEWPGSPKKLGYSLIGGPNCNSFVGSVLRRNFPTQFDNAPDGCGNTSGWGRDLP